MIEAKRNTLTMATYRRELAGLVDEATASSSDVYEVQAIDLALCMAELFNRDKLQAVTLWSRIATGLEHSAKENSANALTLVNGCLLHVQADATRAACNDRLGGLLHVASEQSELWARQWSRWISGHIYIIVAKARAQWRERNQSDE